MHQDIISLSLVSLLVVVVSFNTTTVVMALLISTSISSSSTSFDIKGCPVTRPIAHPAYQPHDRPRRARLKFCNLHKTESDHDEHHHQYQHHCNQRYFQLSSREGFERSVPYSLQRSLFPGRQTALNSSGRGKNKTRWRITSDEVFWPFSLRRAHIWWWGCNDDAGGVDLDGGHGHGHHEVHRDQFKILMAKGLL